MKISFMEVLTLPKRFSNWAFFSYKQRANMIQYSQFLFQTCLPNLVYISTGESPINLQMTNRANTWNKGATTAICDHISVLCPVIVKYLNNNLFS